MEDFLNSQLKAKDYLQEKVFELLDKDVNKLLKPMEDFLNRFKKFGSSEELLKTLVKAKDKPYILKKFNSRMLKSNDCKLAHKENPIDIEIGISFTSSNYNPRENKISIYLNAYFLKVLGEYILHLGLRPPFKQEDFYPILTKLKNADKKDILTMFNGNYLKAVIEHELSHWLDDSKNNRHLLKYASQSELLKTQNRLDKEKNIILKNKLLLSKYGTSKEVLTYFEVNAQIQSIYNLYKRYKSTWDDFTIIDVIDRHPPLRLVYKRLDKEEKLLWLRSLITRLNREDILGKNMNYIPKDHYNLLESYCSDTNRILFDGHDSKTLLYIDNLPDYDPSIIY